MKLTLSKKKPLKITTGAPRGEPDPSQTTVKTVYDPREEKGDQTVRGTIDIAQTKLGQLRKKGALPIGGREPSSRNLIDCQGGRKALMTEAPKEMKMVMGDPMEMVIQMAMMIQMGWGSRWKWETTQERGRTSWKRWRTRWR